MNTLALLRGALTLRTPTFTALRERSDVFQRGFLVVLVVGLLAGAFQAGVPLIIRTVRPVSEQQVTAEALRSFEQSYRGDPALKPMIESYISNGVAMAFEISRLPPQAGAAFRPVARLLEWLGNALTFPLSMGFMGYVLLAGLIVHGVARWLGGRAGIAQMLGLTALAWAPHVLDPIGSLLVLAQSLTNVGIFGILNGLLGWILFLWGAAIYVKATSIAQGLTIGRALGAVLIALGLGLLVVILFACILGALFAGLIISLIRVGG